MLTVHHLENSRSHRVLWALEELGVPYEVVFYKRNPQTLRAPPELKAIHPLGHSPVITDGGQTLAESGAILEYLITTYGEGRLIPGAGTPERLRYTYWMHYAEGSLMPLLVMKLVFGRMPRAPMPFFVRPVAKSLSNALQDRFVDPQLRDHVAFLEDALAHGPYFSGSDFSAADIQLGFPIEAALSRAKGATASAPRLSQWLATVRARPAYQRAVERGGGLAPLE